MQVKLNLVLMNYLVFHLIVTPNAAHKEFLAPCKDQRVIKSHDINCTLFPPEKSIQLKLHNLISDPNVKIIILNFNLSNNAHNMSVDIPMELEYPHMHFYNQLRWQLVRLDVGHNLLKLFLKFTLIDLTKIGLGIRTMDIDLRSEPSSCLTKLSDINCGHLIRNMILDFTANSATQGKEKLSACNQVINENQGIADFQTVCYTHMPENQTSCDFLNAGDGWDYLIVFRNLAAVLVLLFGPFLIPPRLYNEKRNNFLFHLPEELPIKLKMTKTRHSNETDTFSYSSGRYPTLKNACHDIDKEYNATLKGLCLKVDKRRILPRGCASAEFTSLIYNTLFRCKYNSDQTQTCLQGELFPFCFRRCYGLTWYRCCRWFMNLVILLLLPLPWCVRLFLYYKYEANEITNQAKAVELLNLTLPFRSTLLHYIPPFHWFFIIFYVIYFINFFTFGVVNFRKGKKLVNIIKEVLRDMRDHANCEYMINYLELFLWPLKTYGMLCLPLLPFYGILLIFMLLLHASYYFVPMVSLIVRLLRNLTFNCLRLGNAKLLSIKERLINFTTTLIFLLSLVSGGILLTECVCYFVDALFHAFIILILKANHTLPYISLGFLVVFYFFDNVNDVCTGYNKIQKQITDKVIDTLYEAKPTYCHSDYANTAYATGSHFYLNGMRGNGPMRVSLSLLLFIDSMRCPNIPKRFFYEICCLPYFGCPGSLTISYLKSFRKYLAILVFLSFVFVVVHTFFGLYNVSSTNQMLATLAGGFVPLIIQKMIRTNVNIHEVEMETNAFKTYLKKALSEYVEDWDVIDFKIDFQENDTTDGSPANSINNQDYFVNLKICPK